MTAVVWCDVYQACFIFFAFVYVGVVGMSVDLPSVFSVFVPAGNGTFIPYTTTRDAWTSVIPPPELRLPAASTYAKYNVYVAHALEPGLFSGRTHREVLHYVLQL